MVGAVEPYRITTVTTPADSYDLVALEDFKSDLGITVDTDDDFLQRAIGKASLAAAQYCDRVLVAEEVVDTFVGHHSSALKVSHYPIIEINSITQGSGDIMVEGADYRVDMAAGVIYRIGCSWGGDPVVVDYEGGYSEIPLDLQGAATDIVKALQFNRTRDPMLRSENILSGLYAYTLFDSGTSTSGTAQQVRTTLDSYRAMSV